MSKNKEMHMFSMLVLIFLICGAFTGCVETSEENGSVEEQSEEVKRIYVSIGNWEVDDLYNGMNITVCFQNDIGESIRVSDKAKFKIIYEKDSSKENTVYDKTIDIERKSYKYYSGYYLSTQSVVISDFFVENGNYTVTVEYNGLSGKNDAYIALNPDVIEADLYSELWGVSWTDVDVRVDIEIKDSMGAEVILTEPGTLSIYFENKTTENKLVCSKEIFPTMSIYYYSPYAPLHYYSLPYTALDFDDFVDGNGNYTFKVSYKDKSKEITKAISLFPDISSITCNPSEIVLTDSDNDGVSDKTLTITITVRDQDDNKLQGATVTLSGPCKYTDSQDTITGTTDSNGQVVFSNVFVELNKGDTSEIIVKVSKSGYGSEKTTNIPVVG